MTQFVLKIFYISLAVLNCTDFALFLFHHSIVYASCF